MPPSHTSTHHNRESWHLPLVGRNFAFWTQCQTQHPRKVALVPAKPRISKEDSFGNSKYICMGVLSQLPTRCVNTSFLWPGEVWIKHRQCYPPGHVQVKQPTILPYCIRVFANTRQFASCHPGPLFLRKLLYQALGICMFYLFFCKSLYPITLSKLLRWIVSLQVAMLDIFFANFCSQSLFCKLSSDHHFFHGSQLTFYIFRISNVMYWGE